MQAEITAVKHRDNRWLYYSLATIVLWGIWGAATELPARNGFPASLGYVVWALTTIPCALVALWLIKWEMNFSLKAVTYGMLIGLTGAGGQVMLFQALRTGPAYLVFPIISLSPVLTVVLAYMFLRERASLANRIGIILAIISIPLVIYQPPDQSATGVSTWFLLSLAIFAMWGIQAYLMRFANGFMKAETIFFYMMISGLVFIPVELLATDFKASINWGYSGLGIAIWSQMLNSIGALCIVYAFRYGKAILVSPMTNAGGPGLTILISLVMALTLPHYFVISGIVLTIAAVVLLAL